MPTGAGGNDSRGIYQFGENDTQALFSDLLNLGQASTSTQFGVDRTRMTTIESTATALAATVAARTWIPVVPSGVTVGGTGSASINSTTGVVTLTNVQTSLIIAGCLPASTIVEFEAELTMAAGGVLTMNLRTTGGTDATGHDQQYTYSDTTASVGSTRVSNAAAWNLTQASSTKPEHFFAGRLLHANEAAITRLRSFEFVDSTAASADLVSGFGGGRNRNSTAYSAIKLNVPASTVSGTISFRSRAA